MQDLASSASLVPSMNPTIEFATEQDYSDFAAFLENAKRLDEKGLVKLRAFGDVLAAYVAPIYSGSLLQDGPTILGLRTLRLAEITEVDNSYEIAALIDRLAAPSLAAERTLTLPATTARAAWTGITPPRQDWELLGEIPQPELSQWAKDGIKEITETLPSSVGSSIAAKVRLGIWGRMASMDYPLPAGAAFAMAGLGFMTKGEMVKVYGAKGWIRLTSAYGHVICKQSFKVV